MRILSISVLVVLVVLTSCQDHSDNTTVDLTGLWTWQRRDTTFTLDLVQTRDSLKGQYCAIFAGGDRIDCGIPRPPGVTVTKESQYNLVGLTDNGDGQITFTSPYPGASGEADISYDFATESLTWQLKKRSSPTTVPEHVVLIRAGKTNR